MSFLDLASVVLQRGCNADLFTLLSKPQYRFLHDEAVRLKLPEPDKSAITQLVGQLLADRAFQNLPPHIINNLAEWDTSAAKQKNLLDLVFRTLHSDNWVNTKSGRINAYNESNSCALPAETGTWHEGDVQPNCLCVATMLVGFARAVGAPHYLLNIIENCDDILLEHRMRALSAINSVLVQHERTADLAKKVATLFRHALSTTRPPQAHHALLIQTHDQCWWVFDPYLRSFYMVKLASKMLKRLRTIDKDPNDVLLYASPNEQLVRFTNLINMCIAGLQIMSQTLERFLSGKAVGDGGSLVKALAIMADYLINREKPIDDLRQFTKEIVADCSITLARNWGDRSRSIMLNLLYATQEVGELQELSDKINESFEEMEAHAAASVARAAIDKEHCEYLCVRIIRLMTQHIVSLVDTLQITPELRQHTSFEVCHPAIGLGAATMNHLQQEVPLTPGGQLVGVLRGQWIISDALATAHQTGESIDLRYVKIIDKILGNLAEMPDCTIRPLKHMKGR